VKCCGVLWCVVECCGVLWCVVVGECCGVLFCVFEVLKFFLKEEKY